MDDLKLKNKQDYARVVTSFLAEGLRSRRISLERSAEIADKVANNINLLDTEQDFLRLIKELSKDFDELLKLEERVSMYIKTDDRKRMEMLVREYAMQEIIRDMQEAAKIMDLAIKEHSTIDKLTTEFPKFKEFLENKHESV